MTREPASSGSDATPGTGGPPADDTGGPGAPEAISPPSRRRRPPPPRLAPQALSQRRGGGLEGLAWLGRPPEVGATPQYRAVRLLARFLLFGVFRFRVTVTGREHVPARGGYLLVAAAHRGWADPFVVHHALPPVPRPWFLGSAPSAFTARWKERLLHWIGGMLPVWRGGVGVDQHVAACRAVVDAGGVFVQMPEGTVSGPPGRIGPFRVGAALIALRTGASILPLAIAGTEELYLGRRMAAHVLPLTDAAALLGAGWDGIVPPAGSKDELELAKRLTAALEDVLGPEVGRLHPATVDSPDHPRRLRGWLTWLLLARGRLDRLLPGEPPEARDTTGDDGRGPT
jgi:hypothetical protein